jgi:general secretion pathway protein C
MLEDIAERLPISLPLAAACGIAVLSAGALGFQVWRWLQEPHTLAAAGAPTTVGGQVQDPLPIILSNNIFGNAAAAAATTAPATSARSATGYSLRAAFAGDSGSGGAIIEPNGGEARWVGVGQKLPDGVLLKEVHPDHVLLERDGSLERLDFPRLTELAAMVSPAASAAAIQTSGAESSRAEPIPADAPPDEKARLIRQRLEELRNRSRT